MRLASVGSRDPRIFLGGVALKVIAGLFSLFGKRSSKVNASDKG